MKYLLFILGLSTFSFAFAQKTPKLRTFLNEYVLKGKTEDAYLGTKKNFAHFYAIEFSFDKEGRIDT